MQNHSNSCPVYIPEALCIHCGSPVKNIPNSSLNFCCKGCEFIYRTLNGLGLQSYYKFLRSADQFAPQALDAERKDFRHFDDPSVNAGWIESITKEKCRVIFYLPTIHCAACVWLLEKIPSILKGVITASVNFTQAQIEISYNPQIIKLSQIGQTLNSLGYTPVPVTDYQKELEEKKINRSMLFRIGIAGFCAANTMMLSVSIFESFYTGIEDHFAVFLRWASAVIALPAVVYSALPFYRTAVAALLTGALHIDLPIAAAIILAYLAGIYSCINGDQFVYFDSITTLIFLLLIGRHIQSKAVSKARASTVSSWDLLPASVKIVENDTEITKELKDLKQGDLLKVLPGDRIAADGQVIIGDSSLDTSFLNGESMPISVSSGSAVPGGAINIESELLVKVSKSGAQSRIGQILSDIDRQQTLRSSAEDRANKLSSYFVATVFIMSIAAYFIWQFIDPAKSFDIVVAFLTVTCPCALGLAIPAASTVALSRAKKRGIFIRRSDAFEAISQAQNFYFDKTKTLTTGELQVAESDFSDSADFSVLFALSNSGSTHPVAESVRNYCSSKIPEAISDQKIICRHYPGRGITGTAENNTWRLGSIKWITELDIQPSEKQRELIKNWQQQGYSVNIFSKNTEICGIIALSDTLSDQSKEIISFLKSKGKNVFILSGDSSYAVKKAALQLGISQENAKGELYPEQKLKQINGKSCMIGDGLNDAQSMKGSFVSIGLRGGIEATIEVASIFISSGKLADLSDLIKASFNTSRIIKLNLAYAVCYNIAGGTLALAGYINPLFAAFVMPLSSITIIIHSLMNKAFKA